MISSIASKRSLARVACFAVAPFVVAVGCSSAHTTSENVSANSSAYVVGGCECIEEGTCANESFADKPSDDDFYVTTFTGGGMACGGQASGDWAYVADEARYGCGAKLQVTANGKSCIAQVADCGPNKCVEEAAGEGCNTHHAVLDSSPFITQYLFGISSSGYSEHRSVKVTEVSADSTVGCPGKSDGGSSGTTTPPKTTCAAGATAVTRATEWVTAKLHYCQSAYDEPDGDESCWGWEGPSHRCDRESNAAWNKYRSDCSGLVTWAWGLPPVGDGGYVTGDFAPFSYAITKVIPAESLQPGDAVNNSDHVMLFVKWITPNKEAMFIEEPGCAVSPGHATEITASVTISGSTIHVPSVMSMAFTAIRYNGDGCDSGSSSMSGSGASGSCESETLGHSVPNQACVWSKFDGMLWECDNGTWVLPADDPSHCSVTYGTAGGGGGSSTTAKKCDSETLRKDVPDNACVQSDVNSDWYQCANGTWVDRWTDPTACNGVYPLATGSGNAGKTCHSDTLNRDMPDNACVESASNDDWYQCDNGSWTDRWTDPSACNGVYPLKSGSTSSSSSSNGGTSVGGTALGDKIAALALANVGKGACSANSDGGHDFESSCTGNGGEPEYWCADFARWVWGAAGAGTSGLDSGAGSFYVYGQDHGTLKQTPAVGDAVVFNYQGHAYADHVAIVTKVYSNGTIETVSGDWGGSGSSESGFSSTSHVDLNAPAYDDNVGARPSIMGMTISGFIAPAQ